MTGDDIPADVKEALDTLLSVCGSLPKGLDVPNAIMQRKDGSLVFAGPLYLPPEQAKIFRDFTEKDYLAMGAYVRILNVFGNMKKEGRSRMSADEKAEIDTLIAEVEIASTINRHE